MWQCIFIEIMKKNQKNLVFLQELSTSEKYWSTRHIYIYILYTYIYILQINTITPLANVPTEYIFIALTSPYFQNELLDKSTGSATPIINKGKWESILIPLPPLLEQKRIVEKVNQLMQHCHSLEQQVEQSIAHAGN